MAVDPRKRPLTERELQELAECIDLDQSDLEEDLLLSDEGEEDEFQARSQSPHPDEYDLELCVPHHADDFDSSDDEPLSNLRPNFAKNWNHDRQFEPPFVDIRGARI
ncbi:hypothetical protein NQ314_004300 [Rhamnusium bicolor]|uniref:Uncharacterized protein n=1 Tax=Rhamnusium bicolor TaxID=1586634 RepID=A0AAV8ZJW9_9CUCU|nr:hypothetical protein NQ314_004300 [Rhamnusium bicolor]